MMMMMMMCLNPFPKSLCWFHSTWQESRNKIFVDYVKHNGDVKKLVANYSVELSESQSSQIKWGFRPVKWLEDRHGPAKAKKLIDRKKSLGLFLVGNSNITPHHTSYAHPFEHSLQIISSALPAPSSLCWPAAIEADPRSGTSRWRRRKALLHHD